PGKVIVCNVFFFQAEDGIRDFHVTGVQTCALPISDENKKYPTAQSNTTRTVKRTIDNGLQGRTTEHQPVTSVTVAQLSIFDGQRSEERRVGKECRSRRSPYR